LTMAFALPIAMNPMGPFTLMTVRETGEFIKHGDLRLAS
jgi:hypothetical protein